MSHSRIIEFGQTDRGPGLCLGQMHRGVATDQIDQDVDIAGIDGVLLVPDDGNYLPVGQGQTEH